MGGWKPIGDAEGVFLDGLAGSGKVIGDLEVRGQKYRYDLGALTQTNLATMKSRRIRDNRPATLASKPTIIVDDFTNDATGAYPPPSPSSLGFPSSPYKHSTTTAVAEETGPIVQVWLAGEWKKLSNDESSEI